MKTAYTVPMMQIFPAADADILTLSLADYTDTQVDRVRWEISGI